MSGVISLKRLTKIVNRGASPVYDDFGTAKFINQACIYWTGVKELAIKPADESKHRPGSRGYLEKGDILVNSTGTGTLGRAAIFNEDNDGSYFADSHVTIVRPDPKILDSSYAKYVIQTDSFQDKIYTFCVSGSTNQIELSRERFRELELGGIEVHEQKKLADYLDTKTQTLDKILTAKNHTRTHLSELRQAIITTAVLGTGGTAMDLQDTNIPWIGKIPAHWEVKKIKHVATVKARIGWQALTTDEYIDKGPFLVTGTDFRDGTVDWKTAAHVSDQRWAIDSNIQLEEDDLLLTKDGTIGKVAMVKSLVGKATLNSGVFVIRAKNDEYNPRYLYHILSSGVFTDFIEYMKTGSTINHLYQQTFVEFSFPMPPRKEQDEIVKLIDRRLEQVDIAIEKVVKSTGLLEEYRSSLISNVVGGKVEV